MRPLKIILENFGPFEGKHTIDLTNVHAATISGGNENGKSNLMIDAPLFAFYGKARRKPEGMINDLSDNMSVDMTFSHKGEIYEIVRSIKRGKNQSLKLKCGDKDISDRLYTNTQKKLDDILGVSYNLLLSTAVAQQDEINLLSTMTPTERERIMNEMLCIDQWEAKKKVVTDILNDNKDITNDLLKANTELSVHKELLTDCVNKAAKIMEEDLLPNKIVIDLLDKKVKELEKGLKEWGENSKLINRRNLIQNSLESLQSRLTEIPEDNGEIPKQIKSLEQRIEIINTEIKSLEDNRNIAEQLDSERKSIIQAINSMKDNLAKLSHKPITPLLKEIKDEEAEIKESQILIEASKLALDQYIVSLSTIDSGLIEVNQFIQLLPQTKILDDVPCAGMDIHDRCKLLQSALETKTLINNYIERNSITDLLVFEKSLKHKKLDIETEKESLSESIIALFDDINKSKQNLISLKHEVEKATQATELDIKIREAEEKLEELPKSNFDRQEYEINRTYKLASVTTLNKELGTARVDLTLIEKGRSIKNKLIDVGKEISELNLKIKDINEFDSVTYQTNKDKLDNLKKKSEEYNIEIAKLHTQIDTLEAQIRILEKKIDEWTKIEDNLANLRTLKMSYTEIPTFLFEQAIPTLEEYTNDILSTIASDKRVQLRSFREAKNGAPQKALDVISGTSTGMRDFDDLSGSAKFRQSLALRIALARYNRENHNTEIEFLVIDEGFGSLDEENIATMKIMLNDIASHFDLFLMISHVPELQNVFETQIAVNPNGKGEKIKII